jgi:hypothetical protein
MLPLLLAALLGGCALFIVLAPLLAPDGAARAHAVAETGGLADREALAKQALREVEFDHQLGNLAEDDYRSLRERYMRRALAAMKGRYDRERTLDDVIEEQVRAAREVEDASAGGPTKSRVKSSPTDTAARAERRTTSTDGAARQRGSRTQRGKGRTR